ncbi:MAG: class A beta-lactamase-related serine hydrolase [Puniceicoccaceae bacterium]|nr:MAG: class A beta-lactamase-related serine hydrolase [Puniceicoccaceae bacterium]
MKTHLLSMGERRAGAIAAVLAAVFGMSGLLPVGQASTGAVHRFGERVAPAEWLVLGSFPNESLPPEERVGSVPRAGFDRDYLAALGGEAAAVITPETRVNYRDEEGRAREAGVVAVRSGDHGTVDLVAALEAFGPTSHRVAYAFCHVESDVARTVHALFGSDDRATVWVNGERVHRFATLDRGVNPDDDTFRFALREGLNRLLVKVENGGGGWGFALRILSEAEWEDRQVALRERQRRDRAIGMELQAGGQWNSFLIGLGSFPEPRWANPELMADVFGELEVTVRWFDRELNEVAAAEAPGRYVALYEARPTNGPVIRRALTYYAAPPGFEPWRSDFEVPLPFLEGSGLEPAVWADAAGSIARIGGQAFMGLLFDSPNGALLLAALHDRQMGDADFGEGPPGFDPLRFRHQEVLLDLKRKHFGTVALQPLQPPRKAVERSGPLLRAGEAETAGFAPGFEEKLAALGESWAEASGIPFTLMVARGGVIAHDGAYGSWQGRAIDRNTPFDIASISKLITGTLLTRFVDQGLIDLDVPIGHYLPDFPVEGDKVITIRQCMMHLVGTEGHGTFGGFDNPWFENQVLHQLPWLEPGKRYHYNGLSMNLAGRSLEAVDGRIFVRLMHEGLFAPLGMENTSVFDTAYGIRTTAGDLARIGQLLLNRGLYGDREFFSEAAFEQLLPVRAGEVQPDCLTPDVVYGLGSSWERGPVHPDAPEDLPEEARMLLGWNTLSHGSATRSVLRIDYDNDLVIAMCRPAIGPEYDLFWEPMLRAIADHLEPDLSPVVTSLP